MAENKVSSTRKVLKDAPTGKYSLAGLKGDANRLKPMTDEQREIFMAELKAVRDKNKEKNIKIRAMQEISKEQQAKLMAEIKAAQPTTKEKNIEIGAMQELSKKQRAKFMAEVKADMEAYEKSKAKNFSKGGTVGTPRTGTQDYRKSRFR